MRSRRVLRLLDVFLDAKGHRANVSVNDDWAGNHIVHNTIVTEVLPAVETLAQFPLVLAREQIGCLQLARRDEFLPDIPINSVNVYQRPYALQPIQSPSTYSASGYL